ncbi:hypothetical protein BDQ12DRAFT_641852 [Crucibulum laeve]|uniref:Protein kinase domain-containing protein n=1 Tax=Crucibulum laeve TaxID=68775 RepID=A0A5C3MJJ8_9AGAR|nr:hypothetical protein BDQ12DRAFT_641852 [Crucibulum laeve]
MLVATPTKPALIARLPFDDSAMSYRTYSTPQRSRSGSTPTYDSPMLTPSPLRQRPLFPPQNLQDSDDLFLSPFSSPHPFNSSFPTRPQPIHADDDEGSIFFASTPTFSPPFSSAHSALPLATPIKQSTGGPSRSALSVRHMNQATAPADAFPNSTRVGVGTKRKSTPHVTPLRPHNLTPLKVASPTADSGSYPVPFDRLVPLPAPKFIARTPQTKAETEAYLRRHTASLTRLKLTDRNGDDEDDFAPNNDSGCEMEQDDGGDSLFLSNARMKGKVRSLGKASGHRMLVNKCKGKDEVAEAISPGGHVTKRRARSRPVSAELRESVFKSPKPLSRSNTTNSRPRHSGHHIAIAFPSAPVLRSQASRSSSPSEAGSPLPRRRISGNALNPPHRSHNPQPRPPLTRIESATLFFGPAIPQASISAPVVRSRTNTAASPAPQRPPLRPKATNRHSYAGPGSSIGTLHSWNTIQRRSPSPRSSPISVPNIDGDISLPSPDMDDEEMFFNGVTPDSSFVFNLTEGTPSPLKKALPRKYSKPIRDSGIVVSDEDDMASIGSSVGDFLHVMPRASTSMTSICSDLDEGLVTPGTGPDTSSGWPTSGVFVKDTDDVSINGTHEGGVDVDAFIMRTLTAASRGSDDGKKKIPGTPVKKMRTIGLGERPWQSAVAAKVGLRDDCDFKKVPRKSLPAAFAGFGRRNSDSTDSEGEEDSPSSRRDNKYIGLGLGQPTSAAVPRNRWLLRRSSSGAFSSGSESVSLATTPTGSKGIDWQLPKPRLPIHFSPSSNALKLTSPGRSTSGSSTSSTTTLNSPTNGTRHLHLPISGTRRPAPRPCVIAARRRSYEPFGEEQTGRFERDFVEVDEVGSGEFGKVIKVRCKTGDDTEVYAIKKSKRFEGAKHRLRLREEVDILKHLSQAAITAGMSGRHPNVLAYIDSWEEDETLYICTELCDSGNLARFLWEYGRVFPRLDEARVWKIVVDLSNGLRFIHDAGVIHLDLKPSNVFVTKEGRFKIGDFGMASLWPRPASVETVGASIGRVGGFEREGDKLYLAPEVLQGRYGKAADLFSFGMTILETASNIVVPDQGESWHRLRNEDFSQVDLDDSPELLELIKQMMRTDPSMRISVDDVCDHPIVSRARIAMERVYETAEMEGTDIFAASPLASVPEGFLEEILGRLEDSGAMDISP